MLAWGIFTMVSCEKFLEEKPDQKLATIETIKDMQAVLDDYATLNYSDPAMGEVCGDNYYMTDAVFNARDEYDRNLYVWASSNIFKPQYNVWTNIYTQVNVANTILQAVVDKSATINDKNALSKISGQAYFFRAKAFFNALNVWSMPYNTATASILPGVPLRLTANFNEVSIRQSIADGYAQVLADFKQSVAALPPFDISPTRPSKAAAYGMLSRVCLQMRDYENAGKYADSCLQLKSGLLDYNKLTLTANFPMPQLNVEVVFEGRATTAAPVVQSRALINPVLYNMYEINDLRKLAFFRASGSAYIFKGSYEAGATLFNGITTAEMLLTRAECRARDGKLNEAINDINTLLAYRYLAGTFVQQSVGSASEVLELVKNERRKELAFRCMRWLDIRRYNEEGANITLSRTIGGKTYSLAPKSKLYALAIPEDILELSGMQQNER